MKSLLPLLLLLSTAILTAQNFRAELTGGLAGLNNQTKGHTYGTALEYAPPVVKNTRLIIGAGFQRFNVERVAVADRRPTCPGFCLLDYSQTEIYTLRHGNVYLNLGVERQLGKWSARLTAMPTYRVENGNITARQITIPDEERRPNTEIEINVEPGEVVAVNTANFASIDYNKKYYLQLGFEVAYALSSRINLGLGYRRMVTNYEVIYSSSSCGVVGCFSGEQTRFDARVGNFLTTIRYSF